MKRDALARRILIGLGAAAGLSLFSGCATVALTNLTPGSVPENPSQIYTFTLRATPKGSSVDAKSVAPHIVMDGQNFAMTKSPFASDIYEFEYQLPAGRTDVAYYFLADYQVEGNGSESTNQTYTGLQHTQIVGRYVLSLETTRGPVGATVGVLGRGFTPQDVVTFDGTPARTTFASPTALSFTVPGLTPGRNYKVTLRGRASDSSLGVFHIDSTAVTATPAALTLRSGQRQLLTFNLSSPAPAGGLLLDVATDVPESVIMPEVVVPAGYSSVSVSVEGGRPGSGNLVLRGYGAADVTIPVTVTGN